MIKTSEVMTLMSNPSHSLKRNRRNFGKVEPGMDVPYLIKTQKKSYEWFLEEAILNLFSEISPEGIASQPVVPK